MKKVLALLAVALLTAANLHAGNGDLIVNGNLGVGTATPEVRMNIQDAITANQFRSYSINASPGVRSYTSSDGFGLILNSYYAVEGSPYLRYSDIVASTGDISASTIRFFTKPFNENPMVNMVINNTGNVGIGTTDPGNYKLYVNGDLYVNGSPYTSDSVWHISDIKFKKDIQELDSPLDKILKMKGVSYNFRTNEFKEKNFSERRHFGVIAQEIEKVLPEIVKEDNEGNKAVAYMEIIPVLIEAMKEQQKRIEELEKKVAKSK